MKKLLLIVLLAPSFSAANIQTHNVYVHKSGIDTNIPMMGRIPESTGSAQDGVQEGFALGQAIKAKREAKKNKEYQAQYTTDLIQGTGGLKNISADTILPLIQKYPDKSTELLEMLKNATR